MSLSKLSSLKREGATRWLRECGMERKMNFLDSVISSAKEILSPRSSQAVRRE